MTKVTNETKQRTYPQHERAAQSSKLSPVPLTADDVDKLLAACGRGETGHRNRALLLLIHRTGCRVSEALAALPSDLEGHQLHVRHGKGDKARRVTIKGYSTYAPLLDKWLVAPQSKGYQRPIAHILHSVRRTAGYWLRASLNGPSANACRYREALPRARPASWPRRRTTAGWCRPKHAGSSAGPREPVHDKPCVDPVQQPGVLLKD
jgi:integrase